MSKNKDLNQEIEFDDFPNEKYKKFFEKFPEINSLEPKLWKPVHLLAHFAKKYQNHYNVKYKFKYNTPSPANCFEIFQIKKLSMNLTKNPETIKNYIDWAFDAKISKSKRRLTSISFLNSDEFLVFYKLNVLIPESNLNLNRSVEIPQNYKSIFSKAAPLNTYGDLAFLYQSYKSGALDASMSEKFSDSLEEAMAIGFDVSVLSRVV